MLRGPEALGAAIGDVVADALASGEDHRDIAACLLGSVLALYTKAGLDLEQIRYEINRTLENRHVLERLRQGAEVAEDSTHRRTPS